MKIKKQIRTEKKMKIGKKMNHIGLVLYRKCQISYEGSCFFLCFYLVGGAVDR